MKLIIQIPCYNEAGTLATALTAIPRDVPGFETVEILIIDDGSQDDTAEVARANGVHHVVQHKRNYGLAKGFMSGIEACLSLGADVIVNTDADNQYNADDIPKLVQPILDGKAEIVIGSRPIDNIGHFSPIKKMLQKLGSWAVRLVSKTDIPDAPSGFRAISRKAAMQLHVYNKYTYTLETIIQAGQKDITITSVPIRVNPDLRPSRLVRSIPSYCYRSLAIIVRIFMVYRPFRFFSILGTIPFALGIALGIRFLWYLFVLDQGQGKIQSLILTALLIGIGFIMYVVAFVADLMSVNRQLTERVMYDLRAWRDEG